MGQTAAIAVIAVLVRHISRRWVRVHCAGVGVTQRAPVGRIARKRAFMLGIRSVVETVNGVNVRKSRGVLLVRRMSVAKL